MSKSYHDYVNEIKQNPKLLDVLKDSNNWEDCAIDQGAVYYRVTPRYAPFSRWEIATKEDIEKIVSESCLTCKTKQTYKLTKNSSTGEWVVKCYRDGKHYEKGDYYTDDRADAEATMKKMQSKD